MNGSRYPTQRDSVIDPGVPRLLAERDGAAADLQGRVDGLEASAERREQGEVDLATAKELREEADEHLEWLRSELSVESGALVELPDGE